MTGRRAFGALMTTFVSTKSLAEAWVLRVLHVAAQELHERICPLAVASSPTQCGEPSLDRVPRAGAAGRLHAHAAGLQVCKDHLVSRLQPEILPHGLGNRDLTFGGDDAVHRSSPDLRTSALA